MELKVAVFLLEPSWGFEIKQNPDNPYTLIIEQDPDAQRIVLNPYEAKILAHKLLELTKEQ